MTMIYDVVIPSAGESVTECEVARWHVPDQSQVVQGQIIATLETKKVISELEADFTGLISHKIAEGSKVDIGHVIATITHDGSQVNSIIQSIRNERVEALDSEETLVSKSFFDYAWHVIKFVLMAAGIRYIFELFFGT